MARFLVMWHMNPTAPWPTDPSEHLKLLERMWATEADLIKKGEIKESGYFPDGTSGYTICEGEAADAFRGSSMFAPYLDCEVHEIIPHEKAEEITRELIKARIKAAGK